MGYINIQSFDDIFISKSNSNRNFGFLPYLLVGENGGLDNFKKDINIALLKFNLEEARSLLDLEDAELYLYVNGKSSMCFNSSIPIQICKVDDDYYSDRTTWDTAPQMELTKFKVNITNENINTYIKLNVKELTKKAIEDNLETLILGLTGEKIGEIVSIDSSRGKNPPYLCLDNVEVEIPAKKSRLLDSRSQSDKRLMTFDVDESIDKRMRTYEMEQQNEKRMRTYDINSNRLRQFELEEPRDRRLRAFELEESNENRFRPFELEDQTERRSRRYELEDSHSKRLRQIEMDKLNDKRISPYDSDSINRNKYRDYENEYQSSSRFKDFEVDQEDSRQISKNNSREILNKNSYNQYEKNQTSENRLRQYDMENLNESKYRQFEIENGCNKNINYYDKGELNNNRYRQLEVEAEPDKRMNPYEKEELKENRFSQFEVENCNNDRINSCDNINDNYTRGYDRELSSDKRRNSYEKNKISENRYKQFELEAESVDRLSHYENEKSSENRFKPFEFDNINDKIPGVYEKEKSSDSRFNAFNAQEDIDDINNYDNKNIEENRFRPFEMDLEEKRLNPHEKEKTNSSRYRTFELDGESDNRISSYGKDQPSENRFRPFDLDNNNKEIIKMNIDGDVNKYDAVPVKEVSVNNWQMDAALLIDSEENFDVKEVKKFNKMIEEMMPKYGDVIEDSKRLQNHNDNKLRDFEKDDELIEGKEYKNKYNNRNHGENHRSNLNKNFRSPNYCRFVLDKIGVMLDEGPIKLICQTKGGEGIVIDLKSRKTIQLAPNHTYYVSWSIGVDIPKSQNGDFGTYIALDGSPVTESMTNFRYYSDCIGGFSTLMGSDIIVTGDTEGSLQLIYLRENFTGNSNPIVQAVTLNIFEIF